MGEEQTCEGKVWMRSYMKVEWRKKDDINEKREEKLNIVVWRNFGWMGTINQQLVQGFGPTKLHSQKKLWQIPPRVHPDCNLGIYK